VNRSASGMYYMIIDQFVDDYFDEPEDVILEETTQSDDESQRNKPFQPLSRFSFTHSLSSQGLKPKTFLDAVRRLSTTDSIKNSPG
jgi:hypothetical protein